MLPSKGSSVHAGLWEDQHKALQREYNWVESSDMSVQEQSRRKAALRFLGCCEFREKMKYWGSRQGKKKLQAHLGFYSTNRHHQWHNMLDQTCQKDSKLLEADHSTFCDAMREKQELSWTKITHIFLSFQLPVFLFFTLSCVKLSH